MKKSHFFAVLFLMLTIMMTACFAFVSVTEVDLLRQKQNEATLAIVAEVLEEYPEISEQKIVEILNGRADTSGAERVLEKYGIDSYDWVISESEDMTGHMTAVNTSLCVAVCLVFGFAFLLYSKSRKRQIEEITDYVYQINKGNYNLDIDENSEDELSLLKNEIYKTTVMLKEQNEKSLRDKENLKNSLSDISHQLRTPLASIMIMLDNILDDENMPADVRRGFLSDIRNQSNSIKFLVQSILTLSRLDADSVSFRNKNEKLCDIISECINATDIIADIRNVRVTSDCAEDIFLCCDKKWLSEAVINIVKNCIEHSENGEVRISVAEHSLSTVMKISDNGCGIDKEELPHIFERFYKGRNSSDDSIGIGLALSKAIVEKSDGHITVTSEKGKGTIFEITFLKTYKKF